MVNPGNITNYNMTDCALQEVLIFWICVSGKTAATIAKGVDKLLTNLEGACPFEKVKRFGYEKLSQRLKECGIGCYNLKAKSIWELVNNNIDLRTCTLEDLESIYGIGYKTSRCFLMHSRRNAQCAGLDTHILKFLKNKGHDVPSSTPGSKKKYLEIEQLFLNHVNSSGKTPAEFDLDIWNSYSKFYVRKED